jgi:hypothetical protein
MANNVINGTDLFVFANTDLDVADASGSVALAHATSHSLSFKMSTRDTSDKTSGIWLTKAPGRMDVTVTAEGLCAYGSFETIATEMINQTPLAIYLGNSTVTTSGVSGIYASGVFYVTSWDHTAGQEANATYSVTFDHCSGFNFVTGMDEV